MIIVVSVGNKAKHMFFDNTRHKQIQYSYQECHRRDNHSEQCVRSTNVYDAYICFDFENVTCSFVYRVIAAMLNGIIREIDAIYDLSAFTATLDIILSFAKVSY